RVLVDGPALVPAAGLEQARAPPDAAEDARVELAFARSCGVLAPLARAAATHPGRERERHGPRDGAMGARHGWSADPLGVTAAQPLHPGGEVLARVHRVRVHARDELAAGGAQRDVQTARRSPPRVVEDADA